MSFSKDIKDDLIKCRNLDDICDKLEIEAMLRLSSEVVLSRPVKLSFTTNNMSVVRHLITLVKKYYEIEYNILSRIVSRFDNKTIFTCIIESGADEIIKDLELISTESKYRKNIKSIEEKISYLRGAFIVKGSVNSPASKNLHLEIATTNEYEVLFIQKLINTFELNARISKRKNYLICYLKAKEAIADFLYHIGATSAMEFYEDAIITKQILANAKREVNLDLANQDKTNKASSEQLKYIKYLEYNYPLEKLDSKILMVMKVRKEYPEHSMSELLEVIHSEYDPDLTKSGLNHRLRKIKELALSHHQKKEK